MASDSKTRRRRTEPSDDGYSEIAPSARKKAKGSTRVPSSLRDTATGMEQEMAAVQLGCSSASPAARTGLPSSGPSSSVRRLSEPNLSDPTRQPAYEVREDELEEAPDLQLIGEVTPDSQEDFPDIPVRLLSEFCIYEADSGQLVHIERLLLLNKQTCCTRYGASGIVQPYIEDGFDDDEDSAELELEEQHLKLSDIIDFNVYDVKHGILDDKVYIRTAYAWYILEIPSDKYKAYYTDFYVKHHIVCLVVSIALLDPETTLQGFLKALHSGDFAKFDPLYHSIVGRRLLYEDWQLEDNRSYLLSSLLDLREDHGLKMKLSTSPLFRSCTGTTPESLVLDPSPAAGSKHKPQLHQNDERTVVTPAVHHIVKDQFLQPFKVVGHFLAPEPMPPIEQEPSKEHYGNPEVISWVKSDCQSVRMDGVTYSVDDIVAVIPGGDGDSARASHAQAPSTHSKNVLVNEFWFAQIVYFIPSQKPGLFHARWMEHSSKTVLEELENPSILFYSSYECKDLKLSCIYSKVHAHHLRPGQDEPFLQDNSQFYYSHVWDRHKSSFTYLSPLKVDPSSCASCGMESLNDQAPDHQQFHKQDFIYLFPSTTTEDSVEPYLIAQITELRQSNLIIQPYSRFNDVLSQLSIQSAFPDERRLVLAGEIMQIPRSQVAGRCYVIHADLLDSQALEEGWLAKNDHFLVAHAVKSGALMDIHPDDFHVCPQCHEAELLEVKQCQSLLSRNQPLQALELFSGAGGLSVGLNSTPYIQTRWAVELSETAAATYQENHPETAVYCTSTNQLLEATIVAHERNKDAIFPSLHGEERMPRPSEVDFIYGGPPCQSFSGANYNKRPNDPRSALIANFMAWVDYYKPMYFLIENVVGILSHRLKAEKVNNRITGGIEMGMVKFIMRAATSLGYQVHCKVLQAAQYGSPQGRERVIFLGSRGLIPLPEFPLPTHCFPKRVMQRKTVTGNPITGVDRHPDQPNIRSAPFPQVTINDAIGDLPSFDWINPAQIRKPGPDEMAQVEARFVQGIAQCLAHDASHGEYSGFPSAVHYASKAMNDYQYWMRGAGKAEKVQGHYTRLFTPAVVERVVNIPLRADADHEDLPDCLKGTKTMQSGDAKKLKGLYSRLNGNGHFATALTTVSPTAKPGGKVLHPSQKRILTVRECARGQGFPDDYVFKTNGKTGTAKVEDQLRQIGNAVPVPLARALGKVIGNSMLQVWAEHEREGSPQV
ncbi:S-adenosyl-L-methionine-dependent methyltransferase [Heliocybe sulcata]|uniref:Cytosine-specific methyltransferase n=1 Tax=Heliocybe sulcata TaxID=5364 RepID=A0A5C3NDR1_9AGAM|nr:S-adenosyl-L-methionine-dependent methyltransferase [Heliocybe sulcata]